MIGRLDDGRIIKFTGLDFFELVDGEWQAPTKSFTVGDYMMSRPISDEEIDCIINESKAK